MMLRAALPLLFLGAAVSALAIGLGERDAGGLEYSGADLSTPEDNPDEWGNVTDMQSGISYPYASHPLLRLVQRRESAGRYDVLYGGGTFTSYADHPWAGLYAWDGRQAVQVKGADWSAVPIIRTGANKGQHSTAAGRYQIMARTFTELKARLGTSDFAPDTQDRMAYELLAQCGALALYNAGDYPGAIARAARVWTSLPTSTTGEASGTMAQALDELRTLA